MSFLLPIQHTSKLFSHSDTDAPIIQSVDGSIKTLIKACLVTGYGDKASAGWSTLFEDATRIVLRMPSTAQAIGLPDLKIENGAGNYRIVSQNNPTGLDDAIEIASVPLLSKDNKAGVEWHLVATDVGFVLWYQFSENGQANTDKSARAVILLCSAASVVGNDEILFLANNNEKVSAKTGLGSTWMVSSLHTSVKYVDLKNGSSSTRKVFLAVDKNLPEIDTCTQVIINEAMPPIFASLSKDVKPIATTITIDNRRFLRVPDSQYRDNENRNLYIPIDYWEL